MVVMKYLDSKYPTAEDMIEDIMKKAGVKDPEKVMDDLKEEIEEDCNIDITKDSPSRFLLFCTNGDFDMEKEIKAIQEEPVSDCEYSDSIVVRKLCPIIDNKGYDYLHDIDLDEWLKDVLNEKLSAKVYEEEVLYVDGDPIAYKRVDDCNCRFDVSENWDKDTISLNCGYYCGDNIFVVNAFLDDDGMMEECQSDTTMLDWLNEDPDKLIEKCVNEKFNYIIDDVKESLDKLVMEDWGGECREKFAIDIFEDMVDSQDVDIADEELWEKLKKNFDNLYEEKDVYGCYTYSLGWNEKSD